MKILISIPGILSQLLVLLATYSSLTLPAQLNSAATESFPAKTAGSVYQKPDTTDGFSCKNESVRKQFDFWVGRWDVYVEGKKTAESHIERTLGGCMLLENYRNLKSGYTGKSMNFYDAKKEKWIQVWVDSEGSASRYSGELRDGNMYFSGTNNLRDGTQTEVRMEFIPGPNGSVRQIYEQSTDQGKTWDTLFDGTYKPRVEEE